MATLQTDEANILDGEEKNWRVVVYPLLIVLVIVIGGLAFYYYKLNADEEREAAARAVLVQAKTPEDFARVAEKFPGTDQATLALMGAADASFTKHDYAAAEASYQKILDNASTDPELRDSAQLGLASALEADGKTDKAIAAFLEVAQRGAKSAFAPAAYAAAANLYDERGDKDNEKKILTEEAGLDSDSAFVKQAQAKLKEMNAAAMPPIKVAVPPTAATAPAAPAPAPTAPAAMPSVPPKVSK